MNYKVIFHFDKEQTKTLFVKGNSEEDVLSKIYSYQEGKYFDGRRPDSKGFFRINLSQVTYITVYESR